MSLNRSPGQPSSYRSDEELMAVLDGVRGSAVDGYVCLPYHTFPLLYQAAHLTVYFVSDTRVSCDPLSKLPLPHKLAILATMDEVSTQGHKCTEYKKR